MSSVLHLWRKLVFLSLCSLTVRMGALSCYWPDGTLVPENYNGVTCNASAAVTHCCSPIESCLSNGVCFNPFDNSFNTGACSDESWEDESCFQQCLSTTGRINRLSTIYRCDDNYWCCSPGGNQTTCCTDGELFRLSKNWYKIENSGAVISGHTIVAISALTTPVGDDDASTSPTAGLAPGASSNAAVNNPNLNKKIGTAIGAGVGAGIGVSLLVAVGAVLLLQRQRKRNAETIQRCRDALQQAEDRVQQRAVSNEVPSALNIGSQPIELPNGIDMTERYLRTDSQRPVSP